MSQNYKKNIPTTKSSKPTIEINKTATKSIKKPVASSSFNLPKQSSKDETSPPIPKAPKVSKSLTQTTTKTRSTTNSSISVIKSMPSTQTTTISKISKAEPPRKSQQPMRAKHMPEMFNNVKSLKTTISPSKPSVVMSSIHNVTVTSPPPRRVVRRIEPATNMTEALQRAGGFQKFEDSAFVAEKIPRERKKTRTLEPDEIILLKKGNEIVPTTTGATKKPNISQMDSKVTFKESVAFEIQFPENKDIEKKTQESKMDNANEVVHSEPESDGGDYEDDFESYESDFETESSSEEPEDNHHRSSSVDKIESSDEDDNEGNDDEEESEETLPQITVIQRGDKDSASAEKKLDSGVYDLNLNKETSKSLQTTNQNHQLSQQIHQPDSLDTLSNANSDQLDSGIGFIKHGGNAVPQIITQKTTPFSSRGIELMKKIQLDTITFQLFDLKPINYEYFMKIYGNLNALQATTQTNENRLDSDTQTDSTDCRTMWTQHPPQYDLKFVQANVTNLSRNCCGEFDYNNNEDAADDDETTVNKRINEMDPLQQSIKALNRFHRHQIKQNHDTRKLIDLDRLNEFLNKSSVTIARILNRSNNDRNQRNQSMKSTDLINFSYGYTNLNSNFLNALRIIRIFTNNKFNLVLTIHESIDNVYRNEFLNLICVWSSNEPENPIRLLSSWSEISRADICNDCSDIIVCGLKDGSIAMWDLRETYSYCSKLDGYLTHFAATQSIVPSLDGEIMNFSDLGAVVDIKSFKTQTVGYNLKVFKQIQFVSLNDTGIVTIWTLIETGKQDYTNVIPNVKQIQNLKIEYHSPWARVKLIQSAICDLREYLQIKSLQIQSKFQQTRSYFENDIFNDDTLRELQETQNDQQFGFGVSCGGLEGLRFINLDTASDLIYIATNRNYIIICSKTLKTERFRKIYIDESKFLFPTVVRIHPNMEYLLVGLSNGSIMAVNCNQNKPNDQNSENDVDTQSYSGNINKLRKRASVYDDIEDNDDDDDDLDNDLILGKSCAIQNIIRNERKSTVDDCISLYDTRPRTAMSSIFMDDMKTDTNNYQYRILDQQIILSGSVLRKNLVENIEISSDGRKLYALGDGQIRIYDFMLETELKGSTATKDLIIWSICLIQENAEQQHLVLLTNQNNNEVQIHSTY